MKAEAPGGKSRRVEHLHVNGWLLRPGKYTVEAACDGASGQHGRSRSSATSAAAAFAWSTGARGHRQQLARQGEDSLGYNLFYGIRPERRQLHPRRRRFHGQLHHERRHIRWTCARSATGPIRSSPAAARAASFAGAFIDRTRPNVPGVHFYDEPGLTWHKDPADRQDTPHGIPAQVRSYEAAFGRDPLSTTTRSIRRIPASRARGGTGPRWKLGFMDAAWKDAQFGVSLGAARLPVGDAEPVRLQRLHGRLLLQRRPQSAGHQRPRRLSRLRPRLLQPVAVPGDGPRPRLARPNWYLPTLVRQHHAATSSASSSTCRSRPTSRA